MPRRKEDARKPSFSLETTSEMPYNYIPGSDAEEGDGYASEEIGVVNDDDLEGDELEGGHEQFVVEEVQSEAMSNHFGNIAREQVDDESDDSGDEIWRDEQIPDPLSDSDDECHDGGNAEKNPEVSEDEMFALGKCFSSAREFKHALLRYTLKTRYDVKLYISSVKKLGAICNDKDKVCQWRVYCSYERQKRKLQIKVYEDKHTCIRSGYSKILKCATIGQLFEEKLREDPKFKPVDMAAEIKTNYNLNVTVDQCRKAKYLLRKARLKAHEEQFARIWDYEAELHKTNPGTVVDIETTPGATPGSKQRFYRMYLCFDTQRTAWKTCCRPILGVDGAFLKWDLKGQLLAAIGRDGDNRIVPIAWAVVEVENEVNWMWFLGHLKQDLGLGEGKGFTIISDRQKGLLNAIETQFPAIEHRMCARHVLHNWKKGTHDLEAERLFWRIARSYTFGDYNDHMVALKELNPIQFEVLVKTKPETWSRAFFRLGSCFNDTLNNLCESFNKTIREARRKPLLDLLEDIRRQCMVRTAKRSVIACRLKSRFTKSAHKQIEDAIEKSRQCVRYMSTGDMHEVMVKGCSYRVELTNQICGCRKWQLNGIPCEHAASVITGCKLKVEDFVSEFFTTQMWQKTYLCGIQPVEGCKLWPRLNRLLVLPPPYRNKKTGRPSNHARRKSAGESSSSKGSKTKLSRAKRIMTCSKCKVEGHNKTSCTSTPVQPAPKRPRGRPRKASNQSNAAQEGSQVGSQVGSQMDSHFAGSQVGGS